MRRCVPVPDAAGEPRRAACRNQAGAAGALAVLFLPPLLAIMLAAVGLGQTILARHLASHAADLGALAGVQALDLEMLAQGRLALIPGEAEARAREYVLANLGSMFPGLGSGAVIDVQALNPGIEGAIDRITGRSHLWPTVCVVVRLRLPVGIGPFSTEVDIQVHADASAVPR